MESQCLQTDMDGYAALSHYLLCALRTVSDGPRRGPEESLRKGRGILPEAHVLQSPLVCFRFLRDDCYEQVVESIYNNSVA